MHNLIQILKESLRSLAYFVYWLTPKFDLAVIYGWPEFEDSSLALEKVVSQTTIRKIIFFASKEMTGNFPLSEKTRIAPKNSLPGFLYFLFARYVFFTHRCFMLKFPPNVVSVNVWHGMPIKRIGTMLDGKPGISARYTLATSDFWADIVDKSMKPWENILVTGLPRNDRLFSDSVVIRRQLNLPQFNASSQTIAWLPTYRQSVRGEIRLDGVDSNNVFEMPGMTVELLNEFLAQHDAFAFVKPHPMAPFENALILSNLAIIDDKWMRDRGLTLYSLLGQMDILVTDISSIYVDFLILDRPIIHSFPDLEEYQTSRGFSINPVTDYLAGPTATSVEELFEHLTQTIQGNDSLAGQRKHLRKLFHQDTDGFSTTRLLQELALLP